MLDAPIAETPHKCGRGRVAFAVDSMPWAGVERVANDLVATSERVAHPASGYPVARDLMAGVRSFTVWRDALRACLLLHSAR